MEPGIIHAVEKDDPDRLQQLLASTADPYNTYGALQLARCLYIAAARGAYECARQLLKAGAQPNVRSDTNGNTALIIATRSGDVDMVSLLVEAGSDVNKPSKVALSRAIHWAASSSDNSGSVQCLRVLLSAGADVEVRVASGRTPLMLAARSGHIQALVELIQHGAQVNSADNDRMTALHLAAQEGCIDCLRYLLNNGADPHLFTRNDDSALCLAAKNGHDEAVRLLLDATANIIPSRRSSRKSRLTAVHWAAYGGHLDCARVLVNSDCLVDKASTDRYDLGEFIAPSGTTPLMLAARAGYSDVIDELARRVVFVDRQDDDGMTALLYAVQSDHYSCVERLILSGSNPDGVRSSRGVPPISPLIVAITSCCGRSLKVLLKAGSRLDLEGRASHYENPGLPFDLMCRERGVNNEMIQRLMSIAAAAAGLKQKFIGPPADDADRRRTADDVDVCHQLVPMPLSHHCRLYIRRQLLSVTRRGGLLRNVALLELPSSIQQFLLLDELDSIV